MNNQQNSNEVSDETIEKIAKSIYTHYNIWSNDLKDGFKFGYKAAVQQTFNEPITDKEIDAEIERYIKQFWPRPEHGGAVRLGFKRAVRWMQERQVQPVKNEELYEKFKEAIIGFEHDAQQSITGLSNKCLGIAEQYAASKLNNTIEDKFQLLCVGRRVKVDTEHYTVTSVADLDDSVLFNLQKGGDSLRMEIKK